MRFKVVRGSQARSAVGHRLAIAGARSRAATVGALAVTACGVAACGLAVTACGNQNPQAAPFASATASSSPAASSASATDGLELAFSRQRRCVCRVCAESRHLQ